MTPSIALPCGLSRLALPFHPECSLSFAKSTTACGRAGGWMSEYSDTFDVEQGLRQRCVLAPLLFIFFSPWCCAWRITRAGRVDGQRKEEAAQMLWEILYADDAGIVSRSPEGLEKMMTAIVAACAAFVLTVSEAKTEIMCLQTKGGGARAVHRYCSRPGVQNNGQGCVLGRGDQRRLRPQKCRSDASNPEGMGVLRTV